MKEQFEIIAQVNHQTGAQRQNVMSYLKVLRRGFKTMPESEILEILNACIDDMNTISKKLIKIENSIKS
jgi:hypothetical protein